MNAKRRNIVIDLTSLLDVILILLFLVLAGVSQSVERMQQDEASSKAKIERLTDAAEALSEEKDRLQRNLEGYVYLDAHAKLINISVAHSKGENREVLVECGEDTRKFTLTWSNASVVRNALSQTLSSMCETEKTAKATDGDRVVYLLLHYDRNAIYQTDYALLSGVIAGVKSANDHVFSAEYDVLEEEKNG